MRLLVKCLIALAVFLQTQAAVALPSGSNSNASPRSAFAAGAGGTKLQYLDFGGRGAPIILLAGAANSAWIYEEFGQMLARRHRVLALTRRGHGQSDYPASGYDQDTLAEDLRLFMDQQGIRQAILAGHSIAGAELTYFASKHPDRVKALVYFDAAYDRLMQKTLPDDPIPFVYEPKSDADRTSVASFINFVHRTRPDLARYWTKSVRHDLAANIALRPGTGADWKANGAIWGQLLGGASAARPDYSQIKAPALAIYSVEHEDYRLPPNATPKLRTALRAFEKNVLAAWRNASEEEFRREAPDVTIVEIDAGHHVFLHRPTQTLRIMETFLTRHGIH